jgi:hypothetical protein
MDQQFMPGGIRSGIRKIKQSSKTFGVVGATVEVA